MLFPEILRIASSIDLLLNYWESSFEKWAKLLEQESPGGDSAGGGGEGKDRTADILALLKMRKIQSDILFKTKTLDQESFRGNKQVWSLSLKDQQDTLMIDLTDTQISIAEEALNPLFDDAHMEMSKSSDKLSKQAFDKDTQAAQQESKNIISDLINLLLEGQGQGQGSNDNENLTAMEFLMMQMGNEQKECQKVTAQCLETPAADRLRVALQTKLQNLSAVPLYLPLKIIHHPKVAVAVALHQSPLSFRK